MRALKLAAALFLIVIVSGVVVLGAAARTQDQARLPTDPRDPLLNQGPKAEAVGKQAMVSTQLPAVTQGALKVLREGGNAIDAYITAVFLQQVHDYHQVSLFGAGSGLYYEASTSKYHSWNGFTERPLAGRCGKGDPSKVALAGTVRSLEALWKRFGTMEWADYLQPAIRSAEEGIIVTSFQYASNYNNWENNVLIQQNEEARAFYMPDGHLVPVGGRWKMPELAATLRKIASEGAEYLFTGAWGQKFVEQARKNGYCVSMEDMAEYKTRWAEPLRFTYRGHEIVAEPPPISGGLMVGYTLNMLEHFDLKKLGHFTESPETLEIMARAFGRMEAEMRWTINDPLSFQNPIDVWLSKDYGRIGAMFVNRTSTLPGVSLKSAEAEPDFTPTQASDFLSGVDPQNGLKIDFNSNHNVIVDSHGNWVSSLHTGHGGAPGIFIDGVRATGSGVRAETRGPGRRIIAGLTAILVAKDGVPWMALGTPGSPPQPVTQVLVNLLDFEMHPKDAVDAPRFWAFRRDRSIQIESRISKEVREGMAAKGFRIVDLGDYNWHTGSFQIIWRDPQTGEYHGVSDPRRLGYAAGF